MKIPFPLSVSFFLLCFLARISHAQPGALDPSFATNGIFTLHANFADEKSQDVALMSDGKILTLINSQWWPVQNNLIRFHANGVVDSSFGTNGILQILSADYLTATAVAADLSNRILVMAENTDYYDQGVFIYRLLADGSPDLSFGNNGRVGTVFENANNALLVQPDGKIVAAGQNNSKARVERFNDDGTMDTSFNLIGFITLNYGLQNNPYAIAFDASNKILVTGWCNDDLFLTRLLADGTPDNTFSGDGHIIIDNDGNETGEDVAVMPDGKIIVAGFSQTSFSSSLNCWRILDDGSPDNSFGDNGLVIIESGAYFNFGWFLFPNADSTVIVGGSVYNGRTNDQVLYKLLDDGSKDVTFGINGTAGKTFSSTRFVEINAVRTSAGNIIVCGTRVDNGGNQVALSQFIPDGSVDPSFALNGMATLAIMDSSYSYHYLYDFAALPDGKILCAGNSFNIGLTLFRLSSSGIVDSSFGQNGVLVPDGEGYGNRQRIAADLNQIYVVTDCNHWIRDFDPSYLGYDYSNFAVLKLHMDGTVDSSYGISGVAQPTFPGYLFDLCASAAIQPDGKLLLAGVINSMSKYYLIRLNQDGTADTSFGDQGVTVIDLLNTSDPTIGVLDDGKILFAFYNKVLRMLPDGSVDSSYGVNGLSVALSYGIFRNVPLVIQPDNKVITALFEGANYYQVDYTLARLDADGSIDNSFGVNGYAHAPTEFNFQWLAGVQLQSGGKILCGGTTYSPIYWGDVSVLQLYNNGTPDPTFGVAGISKCDSSDNGVLVTSLHLQPDGKILLSGQKFNNDFYMVRLLNDIGTGIEDIIPSSSLLLYPDPVSDQLTIENSSLQQEEATITIINTMGQRMLQHAEQFGGDRITVDVKGFPSGVYILTLKTISGVSSARFVKE